MTRAPNGFTLIEVIVALALTGLILTILTEGGRLGMRAIELFGSKTAAQSDMVPVEHALRNLVEQMDPGIYPDPPLANGTNHVFTFTTELPDALSGGVVTADVRLEVDANTFVLWWTRHARGKPFGAPPSPTRQVILDDVQELDIDYVSRVRPYKWLSNWNATALPALVRVRIVRNGGASWPPIIVRPTREQAEE